MTPFRAARIERTGVDGAQLPCLLAEMPNRPRWVHALLMVCVLTFVGCLHARAGAQDDAPQTGVVPSQSGTPQTQPPEEKEGPSSNADAKAGREHGPPDLSLEELQLDQPGQRVKVLDELYDQLGHTKDAEDALPIAEAIEQIWRISGSDTIDLLLDRADNFVKGADLDMAAQVLDSVVELAPEDAEGWHQRAMVHFMQQDYQAALADWKRGLVIDPRHYKALNGLGLVLEDLDDKKGALEAFRKALEVNPFLDSARQRIEELSRAVEGQDI
jgi:tetratricopeptide (TPR) repeat protein